MFHAPIDARAATPVRSLRRPRAIGLAAAPLIVGLALPYWCTVALLGLGWLALDGARLVLSGADHLGAVLGD